MELHSGCVQYLYIYVLESFSISAMYVIFIYVHMCSHWSHVHMCSHWSHVHMCSYWSHV